MVVFSRAAIPQYQEPKARSLCGGSPEKVFKAFKEIYGRDHQAEKKDARRAHGRAQRASAEDMEVDFEPDDDDNDADYEDDCDSEDDDDVPLEFDDAYEAHEEAYATWQDAWRKMRKLARARGFFPVVALTPQGQVLVSAGGNGKGKPKGRAQRRKISRTRGLLPLGRPRRGHADTLAEVDSVREHPAARPQVQAIAGQRYHKGH